MEFDLGSELRTALVLVALASLDGAIKLLRTHLRKRRRRGPEPTPGAWEHPSVRKRE